MSPAPKAKAVQEAVNVEQAIHRITGIATEGGLFLLALGAPLALGGVHQVSILAACLVACGTLLALWLHRRPTGRGIRVPWYGGVLLGLTVFTALQMVPLPLVVLQWLAPATVEVLQVSLAGAGGMGNGWYAISLDPSSTLWETLKVGTCALAFLVAHNYQYRNNRVGRLLVALVGAGVLVTLLGFVGAVIQPHKPLLFYTPEGGPGGAIFTTSFVNSNHGAAFLMLCTLLAMGLAIAVPEIQRKALLWLGSILLGAGVCLTLSRGGILSLGLGALVLSMLVQLTTDRPAEARRRLSLILGAAALILLLAGWLAYDAIAAELETTLTEISGGLGKIVQWPSGLDMALANPWVGVGRGTFLTTFPRYLHGFVTGGTVSHMENQYIQLPAEWGIPVGVGTIFISLLALVLWVRKGRRDPRTMAMAAALVALAAHNLVDFNLEMLGLALPAAILAGMLSAGVGEHAHRQSASSRPRHRHEGATGPAPVHSSESAAERTKRRGGSNTELVLVVVVVVLLLEGWTMLKSPRLPRDDELRLVTLSQQRQQRKQAPRFWKAVREAIRRHPADYLPHLAAAREALRERRPEALAWLNRALYLNPSSSQIHLETARALILFGRRRQALLQCRLAMERGASPARVLRWALLLSRSQRDLEALLPGDPLIQARAIQMLIMTKKVELADKLARQVSAVWPDSTKVAEARIAVMLASGSRDQALEAARGLALRDPTPDTYSLWIRAAAEAGRTEQEIEVLRQARRAFPGDLRFSFGLARAHLRRKEIAQARSVAEQILKEADKSSTLASAHELLAEIHLADGRPHRARYEAEQARKLRFRR